MGLTYQSTKTESFIDLFNIDKKKDEYIIALAGNPNTGKSTVFNALTGLHQHTGNWPGKTVVSAQGKFKHNDKAYILVDLPGTYSLFASSEEEIIARDYLCFGKSDVVVVVADATCLERNLNLLLQVMELTDNIILCINLADEAKKKGIEIDIDGLKQELGIHIVLTSAKENVGLKELKDEIENLLQKTNPSPKKQINYGSEIEDKRLAIEKDLEGISVNTAWLSLRLLDSDENYILGLKMYFSDKDYERIEDRWRLVHSNRVKMRESINNINYEYIESLTKKYVVSTSPVDLRDIKIDNIVTSKKFGIPIMLFSLGIVFWLTIQGANYPSQLLSNVLFGFEDYLSSLFIRLNAPHWLYGLLIEGLYRTTAWVVAVMLPPMAIFFPIFTLLEDLGYLPRIVFNVDHLFKKACAHGKQCLTMCMGFGCNAAGVIACRIIESPRERTIAIITNNFVPCNGRFPTLIVISSIFFATSSSIFFNSIIPSLMMVSMVLIGIAVTLLVSYLLSKTVLKGLPSTFTLELPPYRAPKVTRILYTSLIDRVIFVLSRAVAIAAPAGIIIWFLANTYIGGTQVLTLLANYLEPIAGLIGLDGFILLAFILGMPANELVLPLMMMCYLSTGSLNEYSSLASFGKLLMDNGWTLLTAVNTMLFSLLHWPCTSTLWTIKKETGSLKWTILSFAIPTLIAFGVCFLTTFLYRLLLM